MLLVKNQRLREEWQVLFVCFAPSGKVYYSGRRYAVFQAFKKALENEVCVHELECLGLLDRNINCLDAYGIVFLSDLTSCRLERLQQFQNVGPQTVAQIRKAIYLLPELEERKKKFEAELMPNRSDLNMIRMYGLASISRG